MLSTVLTTCLIATAAADTDPMVPAPLGTQLLTVERNIIRRTNVERQRHGLPVLAVDPSLTFTARQHCQWMASARNMTHTRIGVGENIAMGQPNTQEVVRCWMNSSGHRANILSRGYRRMGAAAYVSSGGQIYWCQQFLQ
jgi:uncharacterized protein YkwD